MATIQLLQIDRPLTLQILDYLVGKRFVSGIERLQNGAVVNWVTLENGGLSATEKATVTIARGISIIEESGGFPGSTAVADTVAQAVEALRSL
jgi:hypothetical protein